MKTKETPIYHKEIVYLPMDVYEKPIIFWFNPLENSTVIYSEKDFIIGSPNHELTYTMDDLKRLNVADFVIKNSTLMT